MPHRSWPTLPRRSRACARGCSTMPLLLRRSEASLVLRREVGMVVVQMRLGAPALGHSYAAWSSSGVVTGVAEHSERCPVVQLQPAAAERLTERLEPPPSSRSGPASARRRAAAGAQQQELGDSSSVLTTQAAAAAAGAARKTALVLDGLQSGPALASPGGRRERARQWQQHGRPPAHLQLAGGRKGALRARPGTREQADHLVLVRPHRLRRRAHGPRAQLHHL